MAEKSINLKFESFVRMVKKSGISGLIYGYVFVNDIYVHGDKLKELISDLNTLVETGVMSDWIKSINTITIYTEFGINQYSTWDFKHGYRTGNLEKYRKNYFDKQIEKVHCRDWSWKHNPVLKFNRYTERDIRTGSIKINHNH